MPSPVAGAYTKVPQEYAGDLNSKCAKAMLQCDPKGPTMVNITKNYSRSEKERKRRKENKIKKEKNNGGGGGGRNGHPP